MSLLPAKPVNAKAEEGLTRTLHAEGGHPQQENPAPLVRGFFGLECSYIARSLTKSFDSHGSGADRLLLQALHDHEDL